MSIPGESPEVPPQVPGPTSLTDSVRDAFASAMHLAEASLTLLRAELRLARSSALSLVWLGFGLVFFGVGTWLALTVAIALGVAEVSGHPLLGVGTVAVINLAGAIWVIRAMRRCWHDLQLPRTRALIANSAQRSTNAESPNESENPS